MARPGLTTHRKFRRLVKALGSDVLARGTLELLWDTCYESGNDYLGDSVDVELAAHWTGEPGVLTQALLGAGGEGCEGFIEVDPERHGYRVHDLFENAPEYVQKRLMRELQRRERGQTISDLRREAGKRSAAARKDSKCPTPDEQPAATVEQTATHGETPSPAQPAPSPERKSVSSAPLAAATEPPVLVFPVVGTDGPEWGLTQALVDEWAKAYPDLDVLAEARRARVWIGAHSSRRKTARGMPQFLVRWLNGAQDRGRGQPRAPTPFVSPGSRTQGNLAALQRVAQRGAS